MLRTIFWVFAAVGFTVFAAYNWHPVELTLWQNLVLETKVPMLVLLAFVLGFLPTWAVHRSVVWGLHRRIRALETSLKNTASVRERETPAPVAPAPMAAFVQSVDRPVENPADKPGETGDKPAPAATNEDRLL